MEVFIHTHVFISNPLPNRIRMNFLLISPFGSTPHTCTSIFVKIAEINK